MAFGINNTNSGLATINKFNYKPSGLAAGLSNVYQPSSAIMYTKGGGLLSGLAAGLQTYGKIKSAQEDKEQHETWLQGMKDFYSGQSAKEQERYDAERAFEERKLEQQRILKESELNAKKMSGEYLNPEEKTIMQERGKALVQKEVKDAANLASINDFNGMLDKNNSLYNSFDKDFAGREDYVKQGGTGNSLSNFWRMGIGADAQERGARKEFDLLRNSTEMKAREALRGTGAASDRETQLAISQISKAKNPYELELAIKALQARIAGGSQAQGGGSASGGAAF
jgi:hypothetical protein